MEKEYLHMQIKVFMMENIIMVLNKVKENYHIKMEIFMMVNGFKINIMEKEV